LEKADLIELSAVLLVEFHAQLVLGHTPSWSSEKYGINNMEPIACAAIATECVDKVRREVLQ
jgi:hypothetical protein